MKYQPHIDGLRAIAVTSVLAFHAFPDGFPGGFLGVDIFFAISGYLITSIIINQNTKGQFSIKNFYARRIRRIFPSLTLVLTATLIAGYLILTPIDYETLGYHTAASAGFFQNFLLLSEVGYFDKQSIQKPLLHIWSLSLEEQFYIVYPFIIIFGSRKPYLHIILAVLFALSTTSNYFLYQEDRDIAFYLPITRAWELLAGSLLALLEQNKSRAIGTIETATRSHGLHPLEGRNLFNTLTPITPIAGMALISFAIFWTDRAAGPSVSSRAMAVAGCIALIGTGNISRVTRKILCNRIAIAVGLISYPLYLWHWPLLSFYQIANGDTPGEITRVLLLTISTLLAWLTYRHVEPPFRFRGNPRQRVYILTSSMLIIFIAGLLVKYLHGLPERFGTNQISNIFQDLRHEMAISDGWICDRLPEKTYCNYTNTPVSIVVLGDSHARSIYPGIRDLFGKQGLETALLGASGCPPLLGIEVFDTHKNKFKQCAKRMKKTIKMLAEEKSITHVFITAKAPTDMNTKSEHAGMRLLPQEATHPTNATNVELYARGLEQTFKLLLSSGKKITYLHDIPNLGFDIRRCLPRTLLESSTKEKTLDCSIDAKHFEESYAPYRSLIRKIISKYPAIDVVELSDGICDRDRCYGRNKDMLFYYDSNHLSKRGAVHIISKLEKRFFQAIPTQE